MVKLQQQLWAHMFVVKNFPLLKKISAHAITPTTWMSTSGATVEQAVTGLGS